jgi:hypothetical protein
MHGGAAVTVRLAGRSIESELRTVIEELVRDRAVASGEIWQAVDPESSVSTEQRLRGGDRSVATCLMLETLRVPEAERIAVALANKFQAADIGVYRFLCQIAASEQPSR